MTTGSSLLYCILALEQEASFLPEIELYLKAFSAAKHENLVQVYLSIANGAWRYPKWGL